MAKSSANIQKMSGGAFGHNDRSAKNPAYIIGSDDGQKNECNRSAAAAEKMADDLYQKSAANYDTKKGGRVASKKNSMSEIVVNLNRDHKLVDVEKLAKAFEKEYGWSTVQISVHKDEGHLADDGKTKIYNNHAHICFFTLDLETGKQLHNLGTKKHTNGNIYAHKTDTVKMQDITAQVLGMERGEKGSQAKRLDAQQYRVQAQQQASHQRTIDALVIEGWNTQQQLDFLEKKYKNARQELIDSKQAKQSGYQELKVKHTADIDEVKQQPKDTIYPIPTPNKEKPEKRKYEPQEIDYQETEDEKRKKQQESDEDLHRRRQHSPNWVGPAVEKEKKSDQYTPPMPGP